MGVDLAWRVPLLRYVGASCYRTLGAGSKVAEGAALFASGVYTDIPETNGTARDAAGL